MAAPVEVPARSSATERVGRGHRACDVTPPSVLELRSPRFPSLQRYSWSRSDPRSRVNIARQMYLVQDLDQPESGDCPQNGILRHNQPDRARAVAEVPVRSWPNGTHRALPNPSHPPAKSSKYTRRPTWRPFVPHVLLGLAAETNRRSYLLPKILSALPAIRLGTARKF